MPAAPRVSVCVPTYNGAAFLRRALESARRQTFRDFELLVVDDASTDATRDVLRVFARREPRLRVVCNPRRLGLVVNWNRCVALARAPWLKFLFQDDTLHPRALEAMLAAAGPRDELVVCRRRPIFAPGTPLGVRELYRSHLRVHSLARRFPGRISVPARAFARHMARWPGFNCVGEPTAVMVRRRAFARLGNFDRDFVMLCDWELAARIAVNSGLRYVPRTLATFTVHDAAESARNRRSRRFRAEVVDDLLVRHAVLTGPAYGPVRRAARSLGPAGDLRRALASAVHAARERAVRRERAGGGGEPGAAAGLAWALRRKPLLARLLAAPDPRRFSPPSPARVRREALSLLGAVRGWDAP